MTIVRFAKTAVRLPELKRMAKEAIMLVINQAARKLGYKRQAPIAQMPRCPGGTPQLAKWLKCQVRP